MGNRIEDLLPAGSLASANLFEISKVPGSRKLTAAELSAYVFAHPNGVLDIAHGGTGEDNAADALVALLPDQSGHDTHFLQSLSGVPTWAAAVGVSAVDSPGGTVSASIAGGTLHLDINPAGTTTYTAGQLVHTTISGTGYDVHLGDGTNAAAVSARANPSGSGGEARLATANHGADFASPDTTKQVTLCDNTYAAQFAGGLVFVGAGLDVRTSVGFFGTAPVGQQPANQALTDATGGTASTTLSAVVGTGDDATINSNFASLTARLAEVRTLLLAYGLGS